ncbi:HoxN/HupN/NixA family nickel/cobalt transporter [Cellulomonas sp. ATA003]|uniref:HoxN/HupN/NixA family nickel/cobalt transporter n=1 Tax=Cellulomonas sp. ATA003 TaxID=3073064 RepID=UPI00287322D9|nr:HoxN/HupN/NixA family nickel/cobalt transporter [Cellulomonas sp. ATA003]WNB84723.1 HoxN/HupN/NixA family nickel/cobalt transporter [Cellulomonas sp. ATA003]
MALPTALTPRTSLPRPWGGAEKRSLAGMATVVLLLNLVGWGVLLLAVAPQDLRVGSAGVFGVGLGVTAFLLGVRHAFDADHIAAIDNTTRKLVAESRPALSVGFWFALGHSSVVFGLSLLLALGLRVVVGPVADSGSALQQTLGTVGSIVAGTFLILIGLLNLGSVAGIVKIFREMRGAPLDEAELERHLNNRGLLARLLNRFTRRVAKPWHMYLVGLLMGLGFDTATQVALLVLAGGTAALTLPWYAILVLPVLFAAGMSLFDAADGILMARAYRWAFLAPVRKVYYNLTVTALSVIAALGIGATVLLQLLAEHLQPTGGLLGWIAGLDLGNVGYAFVALFIGTWLISLAIWRLGRVEQRWRTADGLGTGRSTRSP